MTEPYPEDIAKAITQLSSNEELMAEFSKNSKKLVQEYLKKFYESHGFIQTSEMYLEDDIPHIQMKRS